MNELIVAEQLRRTVPGGIGTYVRGLVNGLSSQNHRSTIWVSRVPDPDPLQTLPAEVHTTRVPSKLLTNGWDYGLFSAPSEYDLVHATSVAIPPTKAPLTVMVHDVAWRTYPEAFPPRSVRWHEQAMKRVAERADRLIAPSTQTANEMIFGGISSDRIEVIPHGHDHLAVADHPAVDRMLQVIGYSKTQQFLLAVGTLEPRKNLVRLLAAYERMRPKLPEPWPLLVVGPFGWGKKLKPVEGATIVADVTSEELSALFERCRLLAYVPLLEGYGLPVIEAMSKGAPVVTSTVPAAADASFLVDPLNVAAIAEGMLRVATEDELRSQLIESGRAHAKRRTWRASAAEHLRLWESLA